MSDKLYKKVNIGLLSLALILTLSMLSGCGIFTFNRASDGDQTDKTEDTASDADSSDNRYVKYEEKYLTEINNYKKYFDGKDFGGGACKITVVGRDVISGDENMSQVMAEELEERNGAVTDRINLNIVSESVDGDTAYEMLRQAALSGDYYSDIIMLPQSKLSAFAAAGLIANLRSMPSFDYNASFLYPSSVAAGGGGASVYGAAGSASLEPDALSALFFNKDIIAALGLESPYALVRRGEWTIDKYAEYAAAAADMGYAACGAQSTASSLTDMFYFSAGGRFVDFSVGQYPTLAINSEASFETARKASAAVNAGSAVYEGAIDSFASGSVAFLAERLSCMKLISNAPSDWGIVPLPKYSAEQQSYLSLAQSEDALFFALPLSAPDYTMSGDVINCINIMSYGYTADAYIREAAYYYLRDNASAEMMGIIMSNPVYDAAYTFFDRSDAVAGATYEALRNNTYGISSVETAVGARADSFNNTMYNNFTLD